MKFVTWNVLHPDHIDVHDIESKYLEWEWRKEKIREKLSREILSGADVICLQEVDSSKLPDYTFDGFTLYYQNDKARTKKLTKWIAAGSKPEDKPNTLVCTILVKDGLAVTDMLVGSRSLSLTIAGIRVTNVHLEAGRDNSAIHIKHLSKLTNSDVVLGDFNDFPGEPAIDFLGDYDFKRIPSRITFKHKEKNWVIDYVFYKKKFKCVNITWQDDFIGITKDHPSDHMMQTVELE